MLADHHGNAVHLWERDCSVQRRHQKLVEETPSTCISPETRTEMCEAARRLILSAEYTNAATVEFIVDKDGNYYFIEVNARIQVEHPVTEMVTGVDLIKWQIRVAAGEALPWKQEDIRHDGAAIECRINAEDPSRNFQPSPGTINQLIAPGGFGVRFDSHAHSGYVVPAVLRFDDRQAHRPPAHPRRGHCLDAAGTGRAAGRGDQDHGAAAPGDIGPFGVRRGPHRHDVRGAYVQPALGCLHINVTTAGTCIRTAAVAEAGQGSGATGLEIVLAGGPLV